MLQLPQERLGTKVRPGGLVQGFSLLGGQPPQLVHVFFELLNQLTLIVITTTVVFFRIFIDLINIQFTELSPWLLLLLKAHLLIPALLLNILEDVFVHLAFTNRFALLLISLLLCLFLFRLNAFQCPAHYPRLCRQRPTQLKLPDFLLWHSHGIPLLTLFIPG